MHFALVFLFSFIVAISTQSRIDIADKCNPTIFSRPEKQTIQLPDNCLNGTVIWQYPMSNLHLLFKVPGAQPHIKVCIGYIENNSIRSLLKVIDGKEKKLSFPKKDKEVCTRQRRTNTNLDIKLVGPTLFYTYAGYIPYSVIKQ